MKPRLVIATRNAHKVDEISAILSEFEVCDLSVIENPPLVDETGTTFLENSTLKAVAISKVTEGLVLADDSGLEVDALGGEPGVDSSSFGGEEGNDALNNARLVKEMAGKADRTARFRCVMVLARNGEVLADFSGAVEGRIADEAAGAGGFGYDPFFVPVGYETSFAELGEKIKNTLSHRARALEGVKGWLAEVFKNN